MHWSGGAGVAPETVYVGGGTPSMLGEGVLGELVGRIGSFVDLDEVSEFTVEANPESFDARLGRDWRAAGVDRLSLGAQTFHEPALRWMGRLHGPEGPARALEAAREAGFDNVSVDLIFGLPARLGRDWSFDLEQALELEPEHVSLYGLTAEPATPLGRWIGEGREVLAPDDTYEEEYLLAVERLTGAGYSHYEVSNFARPGRESRHNGGYWTGAAYLGVGPGAHSYDPPRRFWNVRDWAEYQRRLVAGESPQEGEELVTAEAEHLERTWLGLRTSTGLGRLSETQQQVARRWAGEGLAVVVEGRVRLTARGWLLLDRLAIELDEAA
jgi:oxygen-independent coproporphyrinogen III oxidase